MTKPVFAPWPSFDREIQDAVAAVLASGKVNQWTGQHVYAFEKEYARYNGRPVGSFDGQKQSFLAESLPQTISAAIEHYVLKFTIK